jgi:exopolysaccharide biosynthesis polyprenyl glycosylphosphotransferase
VVIAQPLIDETKLAELVHALKSLSVAIGVYSQEFGLVSMQEIACVGDDLPVRVVADRPIKHWNAILKVLLDGIVGGALLLFLSPLIVLIALAIKLESPGPAFFRQSRHAWNNDEFMVFKFRSMRWQPKEGGRLQQTRVNDDRITPLGRLLRKTSLDEIPQLFNVMRGEMSLVGPRPHAVDMRTQERLGHEIIATYAHRHRVKPGMTGWSQVKGYRGATETEEQLRQRIELDLYYVENWSLWFDVKILFLTVWIVLRGTNAH